MNDGAMREGTFKQIVTVGDFITFLEQLADMAEGNSRTLEDYLRSVLGNTLAHRNEAPTWQLLAQVLADGLTTSPMPFDPAWLAVTNPPAAWKPEITMSDPFAVAQQMLQYQIADLHRMADAGTINHPYRYGGIDSPTGHRWFNFDPYAFLECASSGMNGGDNTTDCSWLDLSSMLWLGQNYE